jgi:tetratricopeptide (TPR) repeat protein
MLAPTPIPERLAARYRLVEDLGGDRLAEAHLAKSLGVEGFEKTMVARILAEPWRSSGVVLERVHAEATRALRLSHANVVQIFDLLRGEDESGPYLVWMTEHVRGVTLAELVDRLRRSGRTLDLGLVLFLGGEIAKALDHAHRRRNDLGEKLGAVHGALEPRCVVISFEGTVKVANFGIARPLVELAGERGMDDAALPWASPACRRGDRAIVTDDVYAFGALLRALAVTSDSADVPVRATWEELPDPFRAFVERCLSEDPGARPTSAAALHEDLDALAYELGASEGASELSSLLSTSFVAEASVPLPTWAAQQATSSSLLRAAPRASLFPRRDLHAAFTAALRSASQRTPQALVVRGEPGCGVSTAIRQELDRLEAPAQAHVVRTPDDFSPAGAIVVMLRALLGFGSESAPVAPEPIDAALRSLGLTDDERAAVLARTGVVRAQGATDRSRPLRSAFVTIVRRLAEDGLLVLAWDDVASMDDESMELLLDGVRDVFVGSPVVIVLAGLPDDGDPVARVGVSEVVLAPIEREAAQDYVRRVTGLALEPSLVEDLWQRTSGHAGLLAYGARAIVGDIARAELVIAELPTDWHAAARRLVEELPPELRAWAEELAFAGEDALGKLVTRDSRCDALLARGVLTLDDGTARLRFSSETVAAELRGAVPSERRRIIHKALADRGAQSESLLGRGALARFLLEAGEFEDAGQAFLESARALEDRGEVRGALRELERGLELANAPLPGCTWLDHVQQYERLARRVRASSLAGDRIETIEAELAKQFPAEAVHARTLLGRALSSANRFVEAAEFFAQAREGLSPEDPARVRLDVAEAEAELRRGDFHAANKCFSRVELVERHLPDPAEAHATLCLMAVGRAGEGDDDGATALLDRAERIGPATREARAERARTFGFVAFLGRQYDLAYATVAAQLEGIRSDGPSFELAAALHNAGHALLKLDDRARAHGLLRHSLALAEDVGFDRLANVNRGLLGYLEALLGERRGDAALREAIRRANASGFALDALDLRSLLAALMADRGDRGGAWREMEGVHQHAQALRYARLRAETREALDALRAKAGPPSSKRSP